MEQNEKNDKLQRKKNIKLNMNNIVYPCWSRILLSRHV